MIHRPLLISVLADFLNNFLPLNNMPEHHVRIIKPVTLTLCDVELRVVGVFLSTICHTHLIGLVMFVAEIFVTEVSSID